MQSLWMVVAAMFFAVYAVCVKYAGMEGIGSFEVLFYRSIFGLVVFYSLMRYRHMTVHTKYPIDHALRSVVGVGAVIAGIFSISHLNVGLAMTLNYTSPLFVGCFTIGIAIMHHRGIDADSVVVHVHVHMSRDHHDQYDGDHRRDADRHHAIHRHLESPVAACRVCRVQYRSHDPFALPGELRQLGVKCQCGVRIGGVERGYLLPVITDDYGVRATGIPSVDIGSELPVGEVSRSPPDPSVSVDAQTGVEVRTELHGLYR